MPVLQIRRKQFEQLGMASYAARLHRFMGRHVRTPQPVPLPVLTEVLLAVQPLVRQHGFDSDADHALYAIANLCLPAKVQDGVLAAALADDAVAVDEKRYRLSAELDKGGFMTFGALEADHDAVDAAAGGDEDEDSSGASTL